MTPRRTYTGPTHYRTPEGIFGGPTVTDAPIIAVQPVDLAPLVRHSPAVRLTLANNAGRGPKQLETVEWGTPDTWQPAPAEPVNPVVAALTTAGLPAHPHQTRAGDSRRGSPPGPQGPLLPARDHPARQHALLPAPRRVRPRARVLPLGQHPHRRRPRPCPALLPPVHRPHPPDPAHRCRTWPTPQHLRSGRR